MGREHGVAKFSVKQQNTPLQFGNYFSSPEDEGGSRMRSPDESAVVACLTESCPALRRLKLRATLHTFILAASLLFLSEQVAAAYVYPNTGRLPASVGQNQQQPTAPAGPAQNDGDVRTLEAGNPIERELAGGEAHSYRVTLAAGQYLHVVVDQRGIDVVVALFSPDGEQVSEIDSPNGTAGPEPLGHVTEADGSYRLDVRSLVKEALSGRYQIRIEELRAATPHDKDRLKAERIYAEAEQLYKQGTVESRSRALGKYLEALTLYRGMGDRRGEATTLKDIGVIYRTLDDNQKALEYGNQALSAHRAIGNYEGEAAALYNLGLTYSRLGENQKALDCYNQALLLRRTLGDKKGEANALISIGVIYRSLGEKQRALDVHQQALALFQTIEDRNGEASAVDNLGMDYDQLGDYRKALQFLERALAHRHRLDDSRGVGRILSSIGVLYGRLGDNPKSLEYYSRALPLRQAAGDRIGESQTLHNIGGAYAEFGDKRKAIDYYNQSLAIRRTLGSGEGQAESLHSIARTRYEEGI